MFMVDGLNNVFHERNVALDKTEQAVYNLFMKSLTGGNLWQYI